MLNYVIFNDKEQRLWTAYRTDDEGNQVTEAVYASTKEVCLIYLGMSYHDEEYKTKAAS